MKNIQWSTRSRNITLFAFALLTICILTSCARKVSFLNSSVVPAARGFVKIKKDHNSNYVIQIHLSDLAEVKRLQPSNQTYVIWMESGQQATKNIGLLNSSTGFMSSNLSASFETVSASKPTKIFITSENDGKSETPSDKVILSTDNF